MARAVILVGGQGTRLRPLTCNTPKSMVPVVNVPFLEHVIKNLRDNDITEIILAEHHLAQPLKDYFGDGSRLGVRLIDVREDTPRGTAGAVRNAAELLTETFLVLNGDIFHDRNFSHMLTFHRNHGAKATIVLTPVEDPSAYGVVETDDEDRVKAFIEKPKREEAPSNMINAGTYVLDPDVLKRVPAGTKFSFERELFPDLLKSGEPVYAYPCTDYWMDAGTPEKYLQLHRDLLARCCTAYQPQSDIEIGEGCQIDGSVRLTGSVVIGGGCVIEQVVEIEGPVVIGNGCRIGQGAVIKDSVLWDRVMIGQQAVVQVCTIANDCTVGRNAVLNGAVLGDHVVVEDGGRLDASARIFPPGCGPA